MLNPRALYLGPHAAVQLDVGPSLVITEPGRAPARVPLAGIARAVIHHRAQVPLGVLTLLAAAGVPVVLAGGGMEPLALCVGARRASGGAWEARLTKLWAHERWRERYENWLAAQQRLAVRSALARLGAPQHDLRPQTAQALLAAPLAWAGVEDWLRARTEKAWRACITAWLVQRLAWEGLQADLLDRPEIGWHFLHDLVDLLLWDMRLYAAQEAERWAKCARRLGSPPQQEAFARLRKEWIAAFEQRRPRLDKLLAALLQRFGNWLAEVVRCAG